MHMNRNELQTLLEIPLGNWDSVKFPDIEDNVWEEAFECGNTDQKHLVAHAWLHVFNRDAAESPKEVIPTYMNKHYAFIHKINTYIDERLTEGFIFKGTAVSAKEHLKTKLSEDSLLTLLSTVDNLWFGSEDIRKKALLELKEFVEDEALTADTLPNWGSLHALLAWKTVSDLNLAGDYVSAAIHLSFDVSFNGVSPDDVRDTRHFAWHYLTYCSYSMNRLEDKIVRLNDEAKGRISATLISGLRRTPALDVLDGLVKLMKWTRVAAPEMHLHDKIGEATVYLALFPKDETLLDILNRWIPHGKGVWEIASSLSLTLGETVALARENTMTVVEPMTPPEDLAL